MEEVVKKKKKWVIPVIIGGVVLLVTVLAIVILVIALAVTAPKRALMKQLDLGQKYLTEMDYDKAILAYEEALRIDPKNVDAYLGLIGVYEVLAEDCKLDTPPQAIEYYETAKEYASKGIQETGSEILKQKETELEGKIEECKALLNETAIEQIKLVTQQDIYDVLFCQDRSFDAENVLVPLKSTTHEPDGTALETWVSEFKRTEEGFTEFHKEYNQDGSLYKEAEYNFDKRGLLLKATEHTYSMNGEVANTTIECEYGGDGKLLKYIRTSDWGGWNQDIYEFIWNVSEPGYEYTYKEKRTYKSEYGETVDEFGPPSIPSYIWIGDVTKGGIFIDTYPEEYVYEVLEDKVIKEDTGWLYVVHEFERLEDACK